MIKVKGDGIDGVCNNGLTMHKINKLHRADVGVVSAATSHCRSYVARRYPRSGNSCVVEGGRQLNIYGQGALLNEYTKSMERKEGKRGKGLVHGWGEAFFTGIWPAR